ncbi:unannotated protein [freshwater metagenome]|uniref:Unannotated protein n=1 Tax=freshwater metagenome TaxID=449393 RepID=A0A6J7JDV6_9ZZZZ|nr:GAF domain-containing protein [Actinomycetota bacterium]
MPGPVHVRGSTAASGPRRTTPDATDEPAGGAALDRDRLLRVLRAVAEGPGLERLLPAVVELLTDAVPSDACVVCLRDHDRLTVRAASVAFAEAVDRLSFGIDEGACGRVVREGEPLVLPDAAAREDDAGAVPGLPEDHYGSTAVVPLRGRTGVVIGVVVLHARATGAFDPDAVDLAGRVATLLAGPIENARLYGGELRRVEALGRLAALVRRIAGVPGRGELLGAACDGTLELLAADRVRLHMVDLVDGATRVVAQAGTAEGAARPQDPPVDAPERGALAVRVAAGEAGEGVLSVEREAPFEPHERGMLETVAGQVAIALGTLGLVERLTEEHLVRDLFEAIADGRGAQVASRARSARIDPEGPHVVVVFEPLRPGTAWPAAERLESRLRHAAPGVLCDPGPERLRALVPVPLHEGGASAGLRALDAELDALAREEGAVAGRSTAQERLAADPEALEQAAAAARIARALAPGGGARAWDDLGAYRYLVGGRVEPDTRHARAVDALWRYDERRGSELVRTLERYLADRSVVPTARALSIHANTLRQRLERIEHLTDLVIADEDLVSLELAIKLHRLQAPARRDAA